MLNITKTYLRTTLKVLPLALGGLLVSCKSDVKVQQKKPNIVFILADDLGARDLGYLGSKYYETPNVDKLAAQSINFTNGYAASRVCSPSRASIFTGQFTATHGITDWIGAAVGTAWRNKNKNDVLLPPDYVQTIPQDNVTLAEAYKNAGYQTFFAGKWHLGGEGSYPENHGFDINIGGWDVGSPKGGYFSPYKNPKLANKTPGENLSIRLANETSAFIKENTDKPFFAFLSFYAVHGPIQTSEEKWKKYREKAEKQGVSETGFEMERVLPIRRKQDNPVYAGLVEQMDNAIGIVLNTLEELGLDDNTIVVFTSDNGGVASGDAFSTTNLPFRGGKGYQWEGGIREPYLIKVPAVPATQIDFPVSGIDFYPTLLALSDIELPREQKIDGVSLKPIFEGKNLPERPLFWHYPHYGNQGGNPSSIIRKGDWKLIHYWETGIDELYNLSTDLGEQNDVAKSNQEKASELHVQLLQFLNESGVQFPEKDSLHDPTKVQARFDKARDKLMPRLEKQRKKMLSADYQPNNTWWDSKLYIDSAMAQQYKGLTLEQLHACFD